MDRGDYIDPHGRRQLLRELAPRWLATKLGKAQNTIDGYEGLPTRTCIAPIR